MTGELDRIKEKIKADLVEANQRSKSFFNGASQEDLEQVKENGVAINTPHTSQEAENME